MHHRRSDSGCRGGLLGAGSQVEEADLGRRSSAGKIRGRPIAYSDESQLPPTILSKNEKTAKLPCTRTNGHSNKNGETNLESSLEETSIEDNRPQMKPPRTLERTLFDRLERLYGPAIKRVLQVQYR